MTITSYVHERPCQCATHAQNRGHDQGGRRPRHALQPPRLRTCPRLATDNGALAARRTGKRRAGSRTDCRPPTAAGGTAGPGDSAGAGTVLIVPHSGHCAWRPAVSSPVRNNLPHWLQRNSIGIVEALLGAEYNRGETGEGRGERHGGGVKDRRCVVGVAVALPPLGRQCNCRPNTRCVARTLRLAFGCE